MFTASITFNLTFLVQDASHCGFKAQEPLCFVWTTSLELLILSLLVTRSLRENIEVILLEESKILTGLGELTLLHTLSDVPVDEGSLRVHKVELGDKSLGEDSGDSDVVGDHDNVSGGVGDVISL